MFIVRQNDQNEESWSTNSDVMNMPPDHQFPNEGAALSGPFKVPNNILKKQYFYGNCTRNLVIEPLKTNIVRQNMNYSDINNSIKTEGKEKRKPTVNKNSKPKQLVIYIFYGI